MARYNLACSYALTEQFERAANSLEEAIDLGYRDLGWLSRDPDLAMLRKHPVYKSVRTKIKSIESGNP